MVEAIFTETTTSLILAGLTQWDYGQKLHIKGLELPDVAQIHFCNTTQEEAIVMPLTKHDKVWICDIPNILLEYNHDIKAWVFLTSEQQGETIKTIYLKVEKRAKPQDFISENPDATDILSDVVNKINQNIKDNADFKEDLTNQQSEFENRLNQAETLRVEAENGRVEAEKNRNNAVNELVESVNRKLANGDFMPNIQIGNTTTVAAGQPAKVEISGTKENPVLSFEIPKGADGTGAGDGNAITKNGGRQQVDEAFLLESNRGYSLVGFNGGYSVFGNNYNSSLFYSRDRPTIYFEESNEIVVRSMAMMEDVSIKQNKILFGTTQPSSSTGVDGDVYIMVEG